MDGQHNGTFASPRNVSDEDSPEVCSEQSSQPKGNATQSYPMRIYSERLKSFKDQHWLSSLMRSSKSSPQNMAQIWFCTGPSSVQCYACFKEMEEWEPSDDPIVEHKKHCFECLLTSPNIPPLRQRTWKQQIRMDVAIEFSQKRKAVLSNWEATERQFAAVRQELMEKIYFLQYSSEEIMNFENNLTNM